MEEENGATGVDSNQVIEELGAQLGRQAVEIAMLRIALSNAQRQGASGTSNEKA